MECWPRRWCCSSRRSWGTISLCLDMLGKENDFSSLLARVWTDSKGGLGLRRDEGEGRQSSSLGDLPIDCLPA